MRGLIVCLISAALALVSFPDSSYAQTKLKKIRVGVPSVGVANIIIFVTKEANLYAKYGLDGEVITRAEPVIGYMHRGAEKLAEYRDARQTLVLMDRHDWLSAFNNELGWVIAVERLCGIEVPDRAQWIRTMIAEWNRIMNHLVFMGSYPLELGAITPLFYTFREREMVQDLVESVSGARMHHSFVRVGGLKDDLPRGFLARSHEVLAALRSRGPRRGFSANAATKEEEPAPLLA